jgi:hypothetical protein
MQTIMLQTMSLIWGVCSTRWQSLSMPSRPLDFVFEGSLLGADAGGKGVDGKDALEASRLIATLIGEIMEDHVDIALSPAAEGDWPSELRQAGEDIACLASAIAIITRRRQLGDEAD